jgi:hypothetical protein
MIPPQVSEFVPIIMNKPDKRTSRPESNPGYIFGPTLSVVATQGRRQMLMKTLTARTMKMAGSTLSIKDPDGLITTVSPLSDSCF